MSKLVPNSPNGEHCSTCYFRVEMKLQAGGVAHQCHGAPPALTMLPSGERLSEFTFINPLSPDFWCGLYRKQQRRKRR